MNDTDIEHSIAATLRPHGEGEVDVTALRAGTMVRVRAARRRRTALVATGAAVLMALSLVTGERLLGAGGDGSTVGGLPPTVSGAPNHPVAAAASLPVADAPGAAQRPDAVGIDRALLHFDLDLATFDGSGTSWVSEPGVETGSVWTGGTGPGKNYQLAATVILSQDLERARAGSLAGGGNGQPSGGAPVSITVGGRPGTIQEFPNAWNSGQPVWVLWWQPVDGLWAVLEMPADDADTVVAATAGLRLDRSQRCAVPVRIATPPAGTRWDGCSTDMEPLTATGRSWRTAALTFRNDLGGALVLSYGNYSDDAVEGDKFVPNRTVNGRPAMWYPGQGWQLVVPGTDGRNMFIGIRGDGFDEEDALALANAAVLSEDLVNLDTWPARAVG